MKQIIYAQNGPAESVLQLVETDRPTPDRGEVLVEVEAAPIHLADLMAIDGRLPFIPKGAGVPGFEGVGRIAALGADVKDWRVGDRVILPLAFGSWREFVCATASSLWRAPQGAPAEQLALVRVNLSTAYLLLNAYGAPAAGEWIVQNAANSNVAGYVAALAADLGVNVINIVRREALVPQLRAQGRRWVLLDQPSIVEAVQSVTNGGARLAFDAVGGPATARLGACVASGGLVLGYGFLTGEPYQLDYRDAIYRDVQLRGMSITGASALMSAAALERMQSKLEAFMAQGSLTAQIAGVYSFKEAVEAARHAAQSGSGREGKIILVPHKDGLD
jgi:NADPH:quinone reductase-like Zn-dependent oxidoreductase